MCDLNENSDQISHLVVEEINNDISVDPTTSISLDENEQVGERGPGDGRESGHEDQDATDEEEHGTLSQDEISGSIHSNNPDDLQSDSIEEEENGTPTTNVAVPCLLPWGAFKEKFQFPSNIYIETNLRPGEFVMQTLFAEFAIAVEKKIEMIMQEPLERSLSKSLQRGEDTSFDQLLHAFGSMTENCLPSLLRTLFAWYSRQGVAEWGAMDNKYKQDPNKKSSDSWSASVEREQLSERRDLAVEFLFCLVLIEVLKQLPVHPGHDDLVKHIEDVAFKHFRYREGVQNNPNGVNINIVADLYAEVIGVLAQTRFQCVRRRFMAELKELKAREPSQQTTQLITSLLMGMKFFRIKMVPIEEFEASFQFMQECAHYFIEVRDKDKDIKHALAGLFVEILVPVAAIVKNEVNVPCLKNFVDSLYSTTLDMATKNKHKLAIFPLVTCLLCVSQAKPFFLANWHYFLTMCLQHLKNKDTKMARVALESLYRLLWVYMIRIKCESNQATHSRLASIVNSLFPKGSKAVVPRDTPLNIFVKIIQFIAQERLDFAMREIIFDLLSVGRPIKIILTPERMSIGLRAFLVVADSLQQKEGDPPMPRTVGVLPSGSTLRVKKTFLNKMLTEDTARNIGISPYYPLVRKCFNDVLKALDTQFGKPLMMSSAHNVNKEPDELITSEIKPKIDLFRTCIAAIPRLIPDGMSGQDLVDLLSRLTVHTDEELKGLAFQSLQNLVIDFPEWRHDVLYGFIQFLVKEVGDTSPQLYDNGLRMLLQLLTAWKSSLTPSSSVLSNSKKDPGTAELQHLQLHQRADSHDIFHLVEGFGLVCLCLCRQGARRVAVALLKEAKALARAALPTLPNKIYLIDEFDKSLGSILEEMSESLPVSEKAAISSIPLVDMQWMAERSSNIWTGYNDDNTMKPVLTIWSNFAAGPTAALWPLVIKGLVHKDIYDLCPQSIAHAWRIVYTRINALTTIVDPMLPNEHRASLLRSATQVRKPVTERDIYMNLWTNYIVLATRVVPAITKTPVIRCASPDISLGSSPDSGGASDKVGPFDRPSPISPHCLYKILVPLIRCDCVDIRDTSTMALGYINHLALGDLMEELIIYIRESIDCKQENMRRRKRRDALRVQLVRLFEIAAEQHTFALCESVLDPNTYSLQKRYLEYIDGARIYLVSEYSDKDNVIMQIKMTFCNFIRKLIKSFSLEQRQTLIPRNIRKSLFELLVSWSGAFGTHFGYTPQQESTSEFEFVALQASTAVLCCGPCFDSSFVSDEGNIYPWMEMMFNSKNEKIVMLVEETTVLLLEFNPDCGPILDWVIDQCYTAVSAVADICFNALATIFSAREYPCDHYTAIMTVTLLMTGCPRSNIDETALQLLQILDKRFFGAVYPFIDGTQDNARRESSTLDVLLSATYSRSQFYLSKQLAHLHPELTMPIFSEISYRLQTAKHPIRHLLFHCMLPWLYNMELVDPSVPPADPAAGHHYYNESCPSGTSIQKEGWGSAEATEMVLNNLFYITVKFGDENPKEIDDLWTALSSCWPNNLRVIIRYLFIITGMANNDLLDFAKRVTVSVGRARPDRLIEELMAELGAVETLNCLIERTETPPFFRLTSMRKTSSHLEGGCGSCPENGGDPEQGGTIHTKRHSGEKKEVIQASAVDQHVSVPSSLRSIESITSGVSSLPNHDGSLATKNLQTQKSLTERLNASSDSEKLLEENISCIDAPQAKENLRSSPIVSEEIEHYEPHPLPMPEYGGYFAPLTEYLPDSSQPITTFHRCNVAVMLLCDVIVAGIDVDCQSIDWSIHISLMLHIITLGLDHTRVNVRQHCKILLVHLLTVIADHKDHLGVARLLLNNKTTKLNYGLIPLHTFVHSTRFTEDPPDESMQSATSPQPRMEELEQVIEENDMNKAVTPEVTDENMHEEMEASNDDNLNDDHHLRTSDDLQYNIKALIDFLVQSEQLPLWSFEDITSKQFSIKSAEQLSNFVRHIVAIFSESLPHAHIEERMAQIALHLALSCSSRHYAGRSLQVFRCLRVSLSPRMLSELLGRLVETVSEQGEDMQGYVTELMLTLNAAVDALHSDFRPIEFVRELFKSTPNLNNQERKGANYSLLNPYYISAYSGANHISPQGGHFRSTSYNVAYGRSHEMRMRSGTDADSRLYNLSSNLARTRSATSLKKITDQFSADDKMNVLAQLFWISVSMLESDYEYEFTLATQLLDKVLSRMSIDRPDCRDKVEKLQHQLKWKDFPGIQSLLLKGCTSPLTYESSITLLSRLTHFCDLQVMNPSQDKGFPMNVIALLPYMLLHYEDANALCIQAAENIAQACNEKGKQLENLATVMTLYSRRNFSKESFQWTKCVVKYLHDSYAHLTPVLMTFLVEVLEKGPFCVQNPTLNILHCMLHYIDISSSAHLINGDLLRVAAKSVEGTHWKESLRILKLAVNKSSALVVPPCGHSTTWDHHIFTDLENHFKKELPGRTMEFSFDVTQTPIIGRRYLTRGVGQTSQPAKAQKIQDIFREKDHNSADAESGSSLHRALSTSTGDVGQVQGWKRPWLSQARVRGCLVNLLNTCGQRVGLPKSPSVIFSQSSELERQSSMASSTEEVSIAPQDNAAVDRSGDDMTSSEKQFAVFKDFDFLEYEMESQGEESIDNFNLWGVRRRSPSQTETGMGLLDPLSPQEEIPSVTLSYKNSKSSKSQTDQDWWEEEGSMSPSDDLIGNRGPQLSLPDSPSLSVSQVGLTQPIMAGLPCTPSKLTLNTTAALSRRSCVISPCSMSSDNSDRDMTPRNAFSSFGSLLFRPLRRPTDLEDIWRSHLLHSMSPGKPIIHPEATCMLFNTVFTEVVSKFMELVSESSHYLNHTTPGMAAFLRQMELIGITAPLPYIFLDANLLDLASLTQRFCTSFIALHEHLDTYLDKQESAMVCLDGIRSTLKLQSMGDPILAEVSPEEQQLDLSRCIYKLNFQISLLFETYVKLLISIIRGAQNADASDHSIELTALRAKLVTAAEELQSTPLATPTLIHSSLPSTPTHIPGMPSMERQMPEGEECENESLTGDCDISEGASVEGESTAVTGTLGGTTTEISEDAASPLSFVSECSPSIAQPISYYQATHQLLQLVADQEWPASIQYIREHRSLWPSEAISSSSSLTEDITLILNTYCEYLADKAPGMVALCSHERDLEDLSHQMTETSITSLSCIRLMEASIRQTQMLHVSTLMKSDC